MTEAQDLTRRQISDNCADIAAAIKSESGDALGDAVTTALKQLLIDINRIADALEILAKPPYSPANKLD